MIGEMIKNDPTFFYIITIFTFIFGSCMGSFLNVCIWRIPRGESIVHPPSHCPVCNYKIPGYLNVPIIAWLALRGKCANCKTHIPARYILMELITGLIFLFIWLNIYLDKKPFILFFPYISLASILITCSMIDFDLRIIPNKITRFGVLCGIIFTFIMPVAGGAPLHGPYHFSQSMVFIHMIQNTIGYVFTNEYAIQAIQMTLGIVVGYLSIMIVIEVGKVLFGIRLVSLEEPAQITFDKESGNPVIDEDLYDLEDLIMREKDRLVVEVISGKLTLKDGSTIDLNETECQFSDKTLLVKEQEISLQDIESISGTTKEWLIPQEAMGYGDAKLMAVCGAFFGAEMIFYIISVSSLIGLLFIGPATIIAKRHNKDLHFAFGPFIAFGTFVILMLF